MRRFMLELGIPGERFVQFRAEIVDYRRHPLLIEFRSLRPTTVFRRTQREHAGVRARQLPASARFPRRARIFPFAPQLGAGRTLSATRLEKYFSIEDLHQRQIYVRVSAIPPKALCRAT